MHNQISYSKMKGRSRTVYFIL